ncbi:MAG: DedA family protein [Candidatus Nanohaloarchaea archaeon]
MVFENLMTTLLQLISEHGVLAVMLGAVIEEIIVPIPSPAIPMAAGATDLIISADSWLNASIQVFFFVSIPASIASVISSYFVYSMAFFGGRPAISRYGKWIDVSERDIDRLEDFFDSDKEKYYVALFRLIPVVPLSLVSGSAGLFRMDWKQYGTWSFVGMIPRNFFLGMLGWWASDRFMVYATQIDSLSTAVAVLIGGIVAGFLLYRNLENLHRVLLEKL